MMNNDDIHLNNYSNSFNFSMQNNIAGRSQHDDNCIDLLEMINMDDNSSSILMDSCNINQGSINMDCVDSKEDDQLYQEILSALEKKNYQRIATLALSQSQGGQKMGLILNETMLAIEKSASKTDEINIKEKITSLIRSASKNSSSVLRATVAPIRNESIVSSSSTSIANYAVVPNNPAPKSSSQVSRCTTSQEVTEQDWHAIFSPESKPEVSSNSHGSRSLPATPPIAQVPSRPLSSSCILLKNGDSRRNTSTDMDQGFSYQQAGSNGPMSFVQYSNQPGPMMLASGYVPHPQYQPSFLGNNGIVCIVAPSQSGEGGASPQTGLYPAAATQAQPSNYPFLMPQNVLISVPGGTSPSQSFQSLASTCPMPTEIQRSSPATTSTATSSASHGSTLPRILPKPGNRIIAPKTQYSQSYANQISQQAPQQFKRPTANRRTNVRPKSGNKNSRSNKAKDNITMAWEITESSPSCDDHQTVPVNNQSFLNQLAEDGLSTLQVPDVYEQSSQEDHIDHMNIIANLEEFLEGQSEPETAPIHTHVTVQELVTFSVCQEVVLEYGRVHQRQEAPLHRATVNSPPQSHHAVVVAYYQRQSSPDDDQWPPNNAASNSNNNSRMVQLLYAHLGRHSGLLSPLLKCLMPSTGPVVEPLSGPLSVQTRISEQDADLLLTEEDLLADISPVKRDPAHLANLDRLLESCQPPSPVPSSVSSGNHHYHTQNRHHRDLRDHANRLHRDRLPFQIPIEGSPPLSLASISPSPWLRRDRHKAGKWQVRGSAVRASKTLEVPVATGTAAGRRLLAKKSNYQQQKVPPSRRRRRWWLVARTLKCRRRLSLPSRHDSRGNDGHRGQVTTTPAVVETPPLATSGLLKIRIQLPRLEEVAPASVSVPMVTPVVTSVVTPVVADIAKAPKERRARQSTKKGDSSTKRIFLTRKEDRRSSVLSTVAPSPTKRRHSPLATAAAVAKKKKRTKVAAVEAGVHPPLIVKLCSRRKDDAPSQTLSLNSSQPPSQPPSQAPSQPPQATSDRIKLLIRRSSGSSYMSQVVEGAVPIPLTTTMTTAVVPPSPGAPPEEARHQYSPAVHLAPPSHRRPRPQQAVLQFSPSHSTSSDGEVGVAHDEISSLLQRQEQREPLPGAGAAAVAAALQQPSFPSLPVPYLVGSDPSVFMDPHEVELVVVKNSRYKKVAALPAREPTGTQTQPGGLFPSEGAPGTEMFVPGCFVEQDKAGIGWSRSSPSMPVLAPQEPFQGAGVAAEAIKSAHSNHQSSYSQSTSTHQSQPFSDPPERVQKSPLCMATSNPPQYPSSSAAPPSDLLPPEPQAAPSSQSPYASHHYHHSYHPPAYSSSCYHLPDLGIPASKNQMQSPPIPLQTSSSSQLSDYSYFQNPSHQVLQSLVSADSGLFSMSVPSSGYQPVPEAPAPKCSSSSKRSSSRDQGQPSSSSGGGRKQRKEAAQAQPPQTQTQTHMYPGVAGPDLYQAAAHYHGGPLDNYYNLIDQVKLYDYFNGAGGPWGAMAEYYKQAAAARQPPSGTGSPPRAPEAGPAPDYDPLAAWPLARHADPYSGYGVAPPYSMYPSFGVPK